MSVLAAILLAMSPAFAVLEEFCADQPGFYFGDSAAPSELDIAGGDTVKVQLRNKTPVLGFSLGIRKTGDKLTFDGTLGSPVVELVVTKDDGTEVSGDGLKGNSARNAPLLPITEVLLGAALAGNSPGDYFAALLEDGGATAGYVADIAGTGKSIPAVVDPAGGGCGGNEVLVVRIAPGDTIGFSRGDANGDGKINVTDAVVIAQNIFLAKLVFFDCKEMLDVNDDETLDTSDPVLLLAYIFLMGVSPPPPFKSCGSDPSPDTLGCHQSNCR